MRLCLHCKTLNRFACQYCEGCGRSLGCRVCRQCGHANSMTSRFCASCASPRLTTPVFYLPLSWLTRLLVLAFGWALVVRVGPMVTPLWELVWARAVCWAKIAFMAWIALTCGWLLVLSLLPDKSAKVVRAFTKQTVLLLVSLIRATGRTLLWLLGVSVPRQR